jgi:hypothetical protein
LLSWTAARSALANAVKDGAPPDQIEALRRDYRAARAHAYLHQLIAADPPPTPEQRHELAAVLTGARDGRTMAGVA